MVDKKNREKVNKCFKALAEWQHIPTGHKWKSVLVKKIGHLIGVDYSNLIGTWIGRGHIPEHAINKILKLDIPDSIRIFCKDYEKASSEKPKSSPGSMFVHSPTPIYGYNFQNKKNAMECIEILGEMERLDADLFIHAKMCLQMLLDGANIMAKKTGDKLSKERKKGPIRRKVM